MIIYKPGISAPPRQKMVRKNNNRCVYLYIADYVTNLFYLVEANETQVS